MAAPSIRPIRNDLYGKHIGCTMPRNYLQFNFTADMLPAYIVAMATLCRVGFLIPDF